MSEAEPFFGLSPTHVMMASIGGGAVFIAYRLPLTAYLLPRVAVLRATSSSAILMILGLATFAFVPGMPAARIR